MPVSPGCHALLLLLMMGITRRSARDHFNSFHGFPLVSKLRTWGTARRYCPTLTNLVQIVPLRVHS